MHFKLIVAMVDESLTEHVLRAARDAGATGATVIDQARGEGLRPVKTFFGLSLDAGRDIVLFVVEEHLSRRILERIASVGRFEERPGLGIAIQLDIEDAVGVTGQARVLRDKVEEEL